jgi:folate-binding protein YgfZ
MLATTTISTEYTALAEGGALLSRPDSGVLVVSDADRADFLHRMTTNNINALRPGQSAVTVLTSPTARMLFVFTVVCRPDELWLLPAPGQTAALLRHLRGQIFFMDKVKVRDASAEWSRLRLVGPAALSTLAALDLDLATTAEGGWQERAGVLALRQEQYDLPGIELVIEAVEVPATMAALQQAGALPLTDEAHAQARRVELGRPAPGAELTEEYNPLEAGLAWACAENKGCYTGQEIIARQITYDKVTKTLVGLCADGLLTAGAPVTFGGQTVGTVTSVAYSPALQAPLALAILKRPHNTPGSQVMVGDQSATVAALPFVSA